MPCGDTFLNTMEFKERIEIHRSKLEQNVDVEKLYPLLQQDKALTVDDVAKIESAPNKAAKMGKLLDIILAKDTSALQSFHLVMQKMYQHILTDMFIEPQFSSVRATQQESCSTSLTSDSEDDSTRGQVVSDARGLDYGVRPKMTKIIPSRQYDPNSTMSNSFPAFNDHVRPLSITLDRRSPSLAPPSDAFSNYVMPPDKGYDWFFKEFEHAFNELKVLKQQNEDMMDMRERYDQVSKELDHLRKVTKTKSQCLQQVNSELHALKSQQAEILVEKQRLTDEITSLHKARNEDKAELAELRHQQRKAASESGNPDGLGEVHAALLDKYEIVQKDYDVLREQYGELSGSRSAALARLETVTEENVRLRAQLDDLRTKHEALTNETNALKQQCTDVIREWNQGLIRHSQVKETLTMVKKQRDEFCKDFNQTFARHADLKKSFDALRAEKDAAVKEYALVMSERDTVHKEIEQLQDKLSSVSKHAELMETEKKSLEAELDKIRRDMAAVLIERDKYRRERNDMSGINQDLKHERMEFQLRLEQQRDIARKECSEAYVQMEQIIKESYEKTQKEKEVEIDNIIKESEALKKQVEKLKLDLETADQEAENANKNRDKAFSERDKIVQERESMRTLCDNLRRDRDRAVSDLAQALRDSDEFKRQKNEAVKELKEIKNRYEAMVEKDSRRQNFQYVGHNHSRDSAIDADLQDLGAETQEIPIELENPDGGDLGFELVGGKDEPQFPNDPSLFVSHVMKGGVAEGKLRVNDTLLRINSLDTVNIERHMALQMLWKSSGNLSLLVRRRKSCGTRVWQPVQIVVSCQKDSGLQIEQGLYISRVTPGGLVAKYGMLPCVGDRILNMNNIPAERLTVREAMRILEKSAGESVILDVWRQSSPLNSAGSSPTPTSTGVNSPLPEGIATVSGVMSKSDTLAIHSGSWDGVAGGSGSSKNLRSSGSQTDSLDSPGPSPRKALRNHQEQDKVRHSLPMLDKAKEKVEKLLRSRHKSQEREKDSEEKKEKDENSSLHKLVEDCGTQVNLPSTENVIAEFPTNPVFTKVANNSVNTNNTGLQPEHRSSKSSRKRELELDSNSGTWPKTRGQHGMSGPPTVIFAPGHKPVKERPSIRDVFHNQDCPPFPGSQQPSSKAFERPLSQVVSSPQVVHHGSQNSDSSIKYSSPVAAVNNIIHTPGSAASAFSPPPNIPSAESPIMSQPVHSNNLPLPLPSTITSTPVVLSPTSTTSIPAASKSQSYFTVGFMHGPSSTTNTPASHHSIMSSRAMAPPPNLAKPSQIYGTLPSAHKSSSGGHRGGLATHHIPQVGLPANSPGALPFESATVHTHHRLNAKGTQVKSRRPMSTPHRPEKTWHQPANFNWPPAGNRIMTGSPVHNHNTPPKPVTRFTGPPPAASHYGVSITGTPQQQSSAHHQILSGPYRPTSLEVPHSVKVQELPGETTPDGHQQRITTPVGQSLGSAVVKRIPHYYQSQTSSTVSSPPQTAPSPMGPFATENLEPGDRPLSYHGGTMERYSSPSPSQKSYTTFDRLTPSDEFYTSRVNRISPRAYSYIEEDGRHSGLSKRDKVIERIRIPSNTSVNTRSGSVEIVSDRSSPGSPLFHIEYRGSMKCSPNSDEYIYRRKTPSHHETRDIIFEKSSKPMGFQIQRGPLGGIFVSSVNDNSLAAQAGLVIGDQLLEVCGINMRNANYEHAVTVLRQCGDNVTMKVQYNPEKYTEHQDGSSSTSLNSSCLPSSQTASEKSTPKHQIGPQVRGGRSVQGSGDVATDGRRFMTLKKSNPNMIGPGFSFIGGNAVGIFVHEVYHDCFVGGAHSLQRGDHILEFNSVDFRAVTAEKAMMELNRPCATMTLCVFFNFAKYSKIQNMPCDSFYIRANFDRPSETENELSFHRDDIMYVENSLFQDQLGTWFAWLLDSQGNKHKGGIIPSRIRLEDELTLRRTHSESWSLHETDDLKGSRRGSASARRSFFRKRSRHLRNNSKDSHEFSSLSDASLNSDSVPILDDSILGYTQVEKIELKTVRPVVLLAPLAEPLIHKLESESPDKYKYCKPAPMRASVAAMEQSIAEGVLIDFWKEDDLFQCIRVSEVKEICDSNVHCLLNVNPVAIERMHAAKIYPVIIFVRHKSAKQIRDIRDPKFLKERASNKTIKEQFEQFQRIEQDYSHLFSAIVQGGNLAEMCMQIKTVIASEQKKAIWVTTNTI